MKCLGDEPWLDLMGWGERHVRELRSLGYSYLQHGKFDRAEAFFEALVVLCPQEAYDSQCLGALYLELGKLDMALVQLDRALELDPHHFPTLLNKTKTLFGLGRKVEGFALARSLEGAVNPDISGRATALILGHSQDLP